MSWRYRRDYVRPCRFCHRPITGAARNQVLHPPCRIRDAAIRKQRRREVRRAARGLFPGEKKRLQDIRLARRRPTPKTRGRCYCWHVCETPGCGRRFFAGHRARFCDECARRRRRLHGRHRSARYVARHFPERTAAIGSRLATRTLARPAPSP